MKPEFIDYNCKKHLKDIGLILYIKYNIQKRLNIQIIGEYGKIRCHEDDLKDLLLYTKFNKLLGIDESNLKELLENLPLNRKITFNYYLKIIVY